MAGLTDLPGVARKTANVVLGSALGKHEGIVVDTHVTPPRAAARLVGAQRSGQDRAGTLMQAGAARPVVESSPTA